MSSELAENNFDKIVDDYTGSDQEVDNEVVSFINRYENLADEKRKSIRAISKSVVR